MHLSVGHKGVPVSHRSPTGIGSIVYASQSKRGRQQCSGRLTVRPKCLPVHIQFSVILSWSPASQNFFYGWYVNAQQVGDGLQVGRQRDDCSNIEVAVGPAVQTVANAWGEGVVNRGVAKSTLNAH